MAVNEVVQYKSNALKAAEELGYPQEVIAKIVKAKTDGEISRIMMAARKEKFG